MIDLDSDLFTDGYYVIMVFREKNVTSVGQDLNHNTLKQHPHDHNLSAGLDCLLTPRDWFVDLTVAI